MPSVELLLRRGDKVTAGAIIRRFTTVSAAVIANDGTPLPRRCAASEANSMPSSTMSAPSQQAPVIAKPASAVAAFTLQLALASLGSLGPQPSVDAVESHSRLQLLHADALLRARRHDTALPMALEVCPQCVRSCVTQSNVVQRLGLDRLLWFPSSLQVTTILPESPEAWNVVGRVFQELR